MNGHISCDFGAVETIRLVFLLNYVSSRAGVLFGAGFVPAQKGGGGDLSPDNDEVNDGLNGSMKNAGRTILRWQEAANLLNFTVPAVGSFGSLAFTPEISGPEFGN